VSKKIEKPRKPNCEKKPIKILKNRPVQFRFYKPKTEKPESNRTQTEKNPEKTEPNQKKTDPNRAKTEKIGLNRFLS
jgi:hypothetical protein